jgi:hypothetical protein
MEAAPSGLFKIGFHRGLDISGPKRVQVKNTVDFY